MSEPKGPTRADYAVLYPIATRWMDNDVYGHINNVNYYSYFDTAIAHFLMREGGLDPWASPILGYCVESGCKFVKAMRFPDEVRAGLRVRKLGRSSVVYEIGIFKNQDDDASAHGYFVHVFVDRANEEPTPIPDPIRAVLERIRITP